MNTKTFAQIAPLFPPEQSLLIRGATGIGKSAIVRQVAQKLGLNFIDVRGSTMDEAAVGGLPDLEAIKNSGVACYVLPSWYVRSCKEPCLLFLDELNRSMPPVMQSFFQIVLDRQLGNNVDGNPLSLHPKTRVFAAVNFGGEYDVSAMDPALMRRFNVIDLEASLDEWCDWAQDNGHDPILLEFLKSNPKHFVEKNLKAVETGKVVPHPASWSMADRNLRHAGVNASKVAGSKNDLHYNLIRGNVGDEAAAAYCAFVDKYELVLSAEDILNGKISEKRKKAMRGNVSEFNAGVEKILEFSKTNLLTDSQVKNAVDFARLGGEEILFNFFSSLMPIASEAPAEFQQSCERNLVHVLQEIKPENLELLVKNSMEKENAAENKGEK